MNIQDIQTVFEENADHEKGKKDSAYLRNLYPCYGLKNSPERRKLIKPFWDELSSPINWGFINDCWEAEMREMQAVAIDYLLRKKAQLTKADIPALQKLAQSKPWWDSVDMLAEIIDDVVLVDETLKPLMLEWSTHDDFWLRRIAIQHQLYYREKTDPDLLAQIIKNQFGEKERSSPSVDGRNQEQNRAFFIHKSIGWALREYAKTNPNWVLNFIEENRSNLSKLAIREGMKHLKAGKTSVKLTTETLEV